MSKWRTGDVRLISVPYTGTRFVKNLLVSDGVPVVTMHTYTQGWQRWATGNGHKVVAPMRDPMLHVVSCKNRHAHLRITHFNELAKIVSPAQVLCVDREREEQLAKITAYLGLQIRAKNWQPIGASVDEYGWRELYEEQGTFPTMEDAVRVFEPHTIDWLRELGYTMPWLDDA